MSSYNQRRQSCQCSQADATSGLRAQVSVIRSIRLADTTGQPRIKLYCDMTQEAMVELGRLPEWAGCLDLDECSFVGTTESDEAFAQLAQDVPVSFTEWRLKSAGRSALKHICAGINQRRQGLGLRRLRLAADFPDDLLERRAMLGEHIRRVKCVRYR